MPPPCHAGQHRPEGRHFGSICIFQCAAQRLCLVSRVDSVRPEGLLAPKLAPDTPKTDVGPDSGSSLLSLVLLENANRPKMSSSPASGSPDPAPQRPAGAESRDPAALRPAVRTHFSSTWKNVDYAFPRPVSEPARAPLCRQTRPGKSSPAAEPASEPSTGHQTKLVRHPH